VRWSVPGEVRPDLLHNTFGTSKTQPSQGFWVGCTVNREEDTLGIRMASISILLLPVRSARRLLCGGE
jgi:hypothetical protein